jgi:hypothetical protein
VTPIAWTLAAALLVTDPKGHTFARGIPEEGAAAIAEGCARDPVFPGADGFRQCAALLVTMAARESGFRLVIDGDGGAAHGPFQVHGPAPKTWRAAVGAYLPIVRRSIAGPCAEPLALLAGGTCARGARVSRERMAEAARVLALLAPVRIDP